MAFDREGAKAEGWSDKDIDDYLASKKQSSPPVNAVTGKPLGQASSEAIDAQIKADETAAEAAKNNRTPSEKVFDWVKTPTGAALTAIGTGLAIEGGRRLLNRKKGSTEIPTRIDPTFDITPRDMVGGNVEDVQIKPTRTVADLAARAQANREAGLGLNKPGAIAPPTIAPQFSPAGAPAGEIPPAPPYQPVVTGEAGASVAPKTRAPKTQKTFKSIADIPEGMKFSSEVGGADSWLHDAVGPEARKFILEEFNQGKRLGGGQEAMNKAYSLVGQYEDWLKGNIPENILGRSERKAAGVPHPPQYGVLGKAAKVGGAAGLLMTAAQFANAKTPEQKANAGANILNAVIPPSMSINDVGAPTLNAKQFENAYKLGSPYAQTEEAKKARLKEKAGAGRGIAPPSAYQR